MYEVDLTLTTKDRIWWYRAESKTRIVYMHAVKAVVDSVANVTVVREIQPTDRLLITLPDYYAIDPRYVSEMGFRKSTDPTAKNVVSNPVKKFDMWFNPSNNRLGLTLMSVPRSPATRSMTDSQYIEHLERHYEELTKIEPVFHEADKPVTTDPEELITHVWDPRKKRFRRA